MSGYFALIPAAGAGARMGGGIAKQYLPLAGQPMIHHAVRALCECSAIAQVYVVLAREDITWFKHDWSRFGTKLAALYCGGASRAESVLNGLKAMTGAGAQDWVMVHDAARPCLTARHIEKLIGELAHDDVGGLLAVPVADTLKRSDAHDRVLATELRDRLWQAQTPQMFRYGLLLRALTGIKDNPTDESCAVEALGLKPRLVLGDPRNLKVTYPRDLRLAEMILRMQKDFEDEDRPRV